SLRFGFALDIVEAPLTLQVRVRSFVRTQAEGVWFIHTPFGEHRNRAAKKIGPGLFAGIPGIRDISNARTG
ncbi:MAG: hypothetical protein ACLQVJ_07075, partial [Syntrophobacteraceae bacterium]